MKHNSPVSQKKSKVLVFTILVSLILCLSFLNSLSTVHADNTNRALPFVADPPNSSGWGHYQNPSVGIIYFDDYSVLHNTDPSIRMEAHTGADTNNWREIDSPFHNAHSGDHVIFSIWIKTGHSTRGLDNQQGYGGLIGVDFYGSNGYVWEHSSDNPLQYTDPNYSTSVSDPQVFVPWNSDWTLRTLDFVIPATVYGQVVTSVAPWALCGVYNEPGNQQDQGIAWFATASIVVNPSPSNPTPTPSSSPTPTPTPTPPTPTPPVTPSPTHAPAYTPAPLPNYPIPILNGLNVIQTTNPFFINWASLNIQNLVPNATITFSTTPSLTGVGSTNVTTEGGVFLIVPSDSGTLLISADSTNFTAYINGVIYTAQVPYSFTSGTPFLIYWLYSVAANSTTPIIIGGQGQQYYFRSDTYTTLSVSGYGFDSDYTNTPQTLTANYTGTDTVNYGFQVYLFSSSTHSTQLTSGVSAIIPITGNYTGQNSATFNMPAASVILGYQALQVNVLEQFGSGAWSTVATFVSPLLITNNIIPSTWTCTLYINNAQYGGNTYSGFSFGNSQFRSGINNILFSVPKESDIQAWRISRGDYIGFELGSYVDILPGGIFYVLLIIMICGVFYFRNSSFGVVVFLFILFGSSNGLLLLFLPGWIIPGIVAFIILGIAFIFWKVLR